MKRILSSMLLIAIVMAFHAAHAKKLDYYACDRSNIKPDDGDSFLCGDEEIRVLGIDTPEIIHKEHGIFIDQPYGREAASFTEKRMMKADRVVIVKGGSDPYGRILAHILLDGELLGIKLLRSGLAYENISRYGDNGLPEFALEITEAAKVSPKQKFEDPHLWRKKNQVK